MFGRNVDAMHNKVSSWKKPVFTKVKKTVAKQRRKSCSRCR